MAAVQKVLLGNTGDPSLTLASSLCGFPTTFANMLFSAWVCSPTGGMSFSNIVTFFYIAVDTGNVQVGLVNGTTTVFTGTYTPGTGGLESNVIVSVNMPTQTVQVFLNDTQLALSSGGWTAAPASFDLELTYSGWNITAAGSGANTAFGDFYMASPSSFFDLRNVSNRRKFINADYSPVNLAASNGSSVLSAPPQIFLHVDPTGSPTDILTNHGTGSNFTKSGSNALAFQTSGACTAPSPPTAPTLECAARFSVGNTTYP